MKNLRRSGYLHAGPRVDITSRFVLHDGSGLAAFEGLAFQLKLQPWPQL